MDVAVGTRREMVTVTDGSSKPGVCVVVGKSVWMTVEAAPETVTVEVI